MTSDAIGMLRQHVLRVNQEIAERGLAKFTFGNASGIVRTDQTGHVLIKPSGVAYEHLRPEDLVLTDLDGKVLDGKLRPSSDLRTHLAIYRAFPDAGGVVHTHSHYATVWAQAGREIPCLGTTHADHFNGPVPITDPLTTSEIEEDYEANTGELIVRRFKALDPITTPAVLVHGHASFCWGPSVKIALEVATVLEEVAKMAYHTVTLHPEAQPISAALLEKHFYRKHGSGAYYGQRADGRMSG